MVPNETMASTSPTQWRGGTYWTIGDENILLPPLPPLSKSTPKCALGNGCIIIQSSLGVVQLKCHCYRLIQQWGIHESQMKVKHDKHATVNDPPQKEYLDLSSNQLTDSKICSFPLFTIYCVFKMQFEGAYFKVTPQTFCLSPADLFMMPIQDVFQTFSTQLQVDKVLHSVEI